MRHVQLCFSAVLLLCLSVGAGQAVVLWDESLDGDLSNDGEYPTDLGPLGSGSSLIQGCVGLGGDPYDAFTLEIPADHILENVLITHYDTHAFFDYSPLGLHRGAQATGDHVEFILRTEHQVGSDLLQFDSAPGPQGPGVYTVLWGSESNDVADWALELVVSSLAAVPELPPLPERIGFSQHAPNPFRPRMEIGFMLATDAPVALRIFDVNGARVRTLVDMWLPAGCHSRQWDGTDDAGRPASSGTYFCRLRSAGLSRTCRMQLLR